MDEERRFDDELARFADTVRRSAERDDVFWRRQREAIGLRLAPRQRRFGAWTWAAAGAAAAILVIGIMVSFGPGAPEPLVPQVVQVDPDDELIAQIELAVAQELPSALEPAGDLFW